MPEDLAPNPEHGASMATETGTGPTAGESQAAPVDLPKTMHIEPTIGRKVWFWPSAYQRNTGINVINAQPCDATVICVHASGRVNLRVTDHTGHTHVAYEVELAQGVHPSHAGDAPEGCATWMPYQAKAAAKA